MAGESEISGDGQAAGRGETKRGSSMRAKRKGVDLELMLSFIYKEIDFIDFVCFYRDRRPLRPYMTLCQEPPGGVKQDGAVVLCNNVRC